jgi:hypothetical protein
VRSRETSAELGAVCAFTLCALAGWVPEKLEPQMATIGSKRADGRRRETDGKKTFTEETFMRELASQTTSKTRASD